MAKRNRYQPTTEVEYPWPRLIYPRLPPFFRSNPDNPVRKIGARPPNSQQVHTTEGNAIRLRLLRRVKSRAF